MDCLLLSLLGDERGLVLGESSSDGAGLLGSEVEGEVSNFLLVTSSMNSCRSDALLALVEKAELLPLVGVYDGKDTGNSLPDIVDAGELGGCSSGDLASPELDQLALESVSISISSLPCALRSPTI